MTTDFSDVVLHVCDRPEDVARAVATGAFATEHRPGSSCQIVVHGAALEGLRNDAPLLEPDAQTRVEACQVGLERLGISDEALQACVRKVPSSTLALLEAQDRGAGYIRL